VLVIENHTTARRVSPGGFFALWFIFALASSLISGRWKAPALVFFALCGGYVHGQNRDPKLRLTHLSVANVCRGATALILSVIVHPSLLTRLVLLLLFAIIFLLGTFLPICSGRLQPWFVRMSAALAGSTTLIISIALLQRIDGWAHALLRFVILNENSWGGSKEEGLSAAVVLFSLIGVASNWFLSRKFGRNPSEVRQFFLLRD
jgi:hypothetical protein